MILNSYPEMNFHTHTTWCDGKESTEQMILAAIDKGFKRLGFSGHSYTEYDKSYCMAEENVPVYIDEVKNLAEKYADQIEVFCGVEQDYGSLYTTSPFDYVIGSVHAVPEGGVWYDVDNTAEIFADACQKGFGGDYYRFAERFFECEADVVNKTKADIIGHFDLFTKFNEDGSFFSQSDKRYTDAALTALHSLAAYHIPFEINTGAMYKGYRSEPYPCISLIKELKAIGADVMLSSDSHDGKSIGYRFPEITEILRDTGFKSVIVFGRNGFEEIPV